MRDPFSRGSFPILELSNFDTESTINDNKDGFERLGRKISKINKKDKEKYEKKTAKFSQNKESKIRNN